MRRYRLSERNTSSDKLFGRRRIFFCAVFYLIGSLIAAAIDISVPMCLAVGALFLLLFILFRKQPYAFSAMLFSVMFIAIAVTSLRFDSIAADIGRVKRSAVNGVVTEVSVTDSGRYKYKLKNAVSGGVELKHGVYVYTDTDDYRLGDEIRAYGEIRQPLAKSSEYDFDSRLYHASENVSVTVYAYFTEKRSDQANIVQRLRNITEDKIDLLYGDKAGTAKAMLIGMDEDIDRSVMSAYRDAGISHILCISGLHVSIIIAAVSLLLRKLKTAKLLIYSITVSFLLIYTLLAGASDSIVRAAVLNFMLLTAQIIHRRGDMLTALSVGFFVCVMMNPLCMFGIGFQLSFGCVFTLICLGDRFGENKIVSAIGSAVCGLTASSFILWNVTHEFTPIVILFNVVAIPLASVALIVLLISLVVFVIFGSAFPQIGIVGRMFIGLMDEIAMISEKLSAVITVKALPPIAVICAFVGIFFASKYLIAPRIVKIVCSASMFMVFAALLLIPQDMPKLRIDFLAHEYADTAVVRDDKGNCVLIDAGNPYGSAFLASYGIEADAVFLTSEAQRSIGGAEQYPNARFYAPADMENGMSFDIGDDIRLTAIKGKDEEHVDYLVQCGRENILLYMGSSAKDHPYPEADVLKLSSDGKKNVAFAGNIGAEYVILREDTNSVDAISLMKAGVVTVTWDGELKVESNYDGRTISESTES